MFYLILANPGKNTCSEFIFCTRTLELLGERACFYLWQIDQGKKQSPMRIAFSSRTGQPMFTVWRPGKQLIVLKESVLNLNLERSGTLQYDINMAFKRNLQFFKNNLITRRT